MSQSPISLSPRALFRYAVISQVQARLTSGETLAIAVRKTAEIAHVGPDNRRRKVSARSIYRWRIAYNMLGLPGLEDTPRPQHSTDGVLDPALVAFLCAEKLQDPRASIPELIRRAVHIGLLSHVDDVNRTTVWRNLKRRGVLTTRQRNRRDQRRFQKAHRLQMVLCDGKHFRAGPTGVKRVVLFFLDDATRFIPTVVVGTSESSALFLRGVHHLLRAVGRIDGIYVDHGTGFTSHDTRAVLANLEIAHILGEVAYPQARGKIERFNRTVQEDLIRHLRAPTVDPDCTALELRFEHYLKHEYGPRSHGGLSGKTSPQSAYSSDPRELRPYLDADALRRHFFVSITRTVTNDHTISVDGTRWEVPMGLAQNTITLSRDVFDLTKILLVHNGQTVRLRHVDLISNADAHRSNAQKPLPPPTTVTTGAASRAFDANFSPITTPDGGFADPSPKKDDQ